jgi:crotonobetainyl-CoA:carnitine CoA-transferase CaiB-like acyl-CoA transferase
MKPLDGIRILDFSRVLAGPMGTQILAEIGADVIKIERPRGGDESRFFEPILPNGESAYFFAVNRGKRSITLNLKSPRGQRIAQDLARDVDVVVENFLPGEMERMNLGFARLAEINPRLIYVSNTGFGQTGPYRDRNGYDTIFQALSGVMALTGHPDGPPAKVGVPFADLTSGLWIAISILTSLLGRAKTGRGCHVDLSMMDVQVSLLSIPAARLFALGEDPQRVGTEHLGRVPSAAFECADGTWLHISGSDQHWQATCDILGLPDLAADPALANNAGRVNDRVRVMREMRYAVGKRERAPLAEALRAAGVPAGELNGVRDILDDPHTVFRDMVGAFDHPRAGSFPALRTPLRHAGEQPPALGTPPLLGADTDDILRDALGLSAAEIAALHADGVV